MKTNTLIEISTRPTDECSSTLQATVRSTHFNLFDFECKIFHYKKGLLHTVIKNEEFKESSSYFNCYIDRYDDEEQSCFLDEIRSIVYAKTNRQVCITKDF